MPTHRGTEGRTGLNTIVPRSTLKRRRGTNKALSHTCIVKHRETLGKYKVVNINVLISHVTRFQFLIFFFNFQETTPPPTRSYTAQIYVPSISKKKIESVLGHRDTGRTSSWYWKSIEEISYYFKDFSFFQFSRKSKLTLCAQLQYMFFLCARGELNALRGYGDTGRINPYFKVSTNGQTDGKKSKPP